MSFLFQTLKFVPQRSDAFFSRSVLLLSIIPLFSSSSHRSTESLHRQFESVVYTSRQACWQQWKLPAALFTLFIHTVAPAVDHKRRIEAHTNKMATTHPTCGGFSAYLNIALNNPSRDRVGRKRGRDKEQGANGWLKEWRHHYLTSCSGPSNQSAFEFHVNEPPLRSETK